jgi:hypothetical protein
MLKQYDNQTIGIIKKTHSLSRLDRINGSLTIDSINIDKLNLSDEHTKKKIENPTKRKSYYTTNEQIYKKSIFKIIIINEEEIKKKSDIQYDDYNDEYYKTTEWNRDIRSFSELVPSSKFGHISIATGFLININDIQYFITVAHSFTNNKKCKIFINNIIFECKIACIDFIFDICILEVDDKNNTLTNNCIFHINSIDKINDLFDIKFPQKKTTAFLLRNNGEYIISRVSDIHYKNNTNFPVINLVSLNKNIIHGDSGTIILDQNKKKIIGIQLSRSLSDKKVYNIIPSIYIIRILKEYLQNGIYLGTCGIFPKLEYIRENQYEDKNIICLTITNSYNINYNIQPNPDSPMQKGRHLLKNNDTIISIDNNKFIIDDNKQLYIKYTDIDYNVSLDTYLALKYSINEAFSVEIKNKNTIKKKYINCRPIHSILNIEQYTDEYKACNINNFIFKNLSIIYIYNYCVYNDIPFEKYLNDLILNKYNVITERIKNAEKIGKKTEMEIRDDCNYNIIFLDNYIGDNDSLKKIINNIDCSDTINFYELYKVNDKNISNIIQLPNIENIININIINRIKKVEYRIIFSESSTSYERIY